VFLPYPIYSAPYYPVVEQPAPEASNREGDLATEIEQLKDEIARLRAEETSREEERRAATPPLPVKENEPTVLVFRDGHQSEVQNYAIVGQTLWALSEQRARKIPMSDLDVEATKKVNANRSVEIRLP